MITDADDMDAGGDGSEQGRSLPARLYRGILSSPVIAGLVFGVIILVAGLLVFSGSHPTNVKQPDPLVVTVSAETPAAAPAGVKPATLSDNSAPSTQVPVVAEAALLVTDVGLSRRISEAVIRQLPTETSIAISPYATNAAATIAAYKSAGNDVWLQIAVRSTTAGVDAGPLALSAGLANNENQNYLQQQINTAGGGFVGLYIPSDADITGDADHWKAMALDLIGKNLMILDATPTKVATELYIPQRESHISAYLKADVVIPGDQGPDALKAGLSGAMPIILREREAIVVINRPTTLAITMVADWLKTLRNQGISLVPASRFTGLKP